MQTHHKWISVSPTKLQSNLTARKPLLYYNHTGKLWKKHSAITVRSSIKTIILVSKSLKKKTLRIWPHPLGNCLLLDPLSIGTSDALCGGKYKPHPGMEGNSFHFLMNLCRYTCNSCCSHCIIFSLNFLNSLLLLNVHVFSADTKHERRFKITSVNW